MKREGNKKIAFLLTLVMLIGLLVPITYGVQEVDAATKKASFVESFEMVYSPGEQNYSMIYLENIKKGATYSIEISNKKVAEYMGKGTYTGNGIGFTIKLNKAGTFRATVKETYKNKVTKVGTKKFTVDEISWVGGDSRSNVKMENGTSFSIHLFSLNGIDVHGEYTAKSNDSSVVAIETKAGKKVLTAKGTGTAKIKYTYNYNGEKRTWTMTVTVVDSGSISDSEEGKTIAESVETCCGEKVTESNAVSLLKEARELLDQISSNALEFDYINNEVIIKIPTIYDDNDLNEVINECRDILGVTLPQDYLGASLEVVKITKISKNSVTVKLSHAVTEGELASVRSDYYDIVVGDSEGQTYLFYGTVAEGDTTITATLAEGFSKLKSGKKYYACVGTTDGKGLKLIKATCQK